MSSKRYAARDGLTGRHPELSGREIGRARYVGASTTPGKPDPASPPELARSHCCIHEYVRVDDEYRCTCCGAAMPKPKQQ